MTIIKDRQFLPDNARPAVDLVEVFGFKHWHLDTEHELLERSTRIQIRSEKHNAPREEVNRYAECMKRRDRFPPIVISKDGHTVDGNTRTEAAKKAGLLYHPTLVLEENYSGASTSVNNRFFLLGAAFNTRNGRGIDREEIRQAIEKIGQDSGYDSARIAKLLSITEVTVRNIINERRVRERADRIGIHVNGEVPKSVMRRIGSADGSLNDGPFKALLELARDAPLTVNDIVLLLNAMRESRSDDGALSVILKEREARREEIAEYRATAKKPRPSLAAQLRQSFGFLLKHGDNLADLVEVIADRQEEALAKIDKYLSLLNELRDLQVEENSPSPVPPTQTMRGQRRSSTLRSGK